MDIPAIDERNQRFLAFLTAMDVAVSVPSKVTAEDLTYFSEVFQKLWDAEEYTLCSVLWSHLAKNPSLKKRAMGHLEPVVHSLGRWVSHSMRMAC